MTPREIAKTAAKIALDKKALDLVVLRVTRLTSLADFFIICGGGSNTQLRGITGAIEEGLAEKNVFPKHIEGYSSASWILLDYGTVVVHVLKNDVRTFYDLERLWADAERINVTEFLNSADGHAADEEDHIEDKSRDKK